MAHFAVIEDGAVINTIVAETLDIAQTVSGKTCVEFEHIAGAVGTGWGYDGTDFIPPTPATVETAFIANEPKSIPQADPTPILGAISK
jgi:hypothetical protein